MVSDIICPWCYVGKKRLERAIQLTNSQDQVKLSYAPHLLYPDIPIDGKKTSDFPRKHGMGGVLHEAGADVGITFDFKSIKTVPNTLQLHYILANLGDDQATMRVKEAMFKAYFSEGQDLTDRDVVDSIVLGQGLTANWKANPIVDNSLTANKNKGISVVPTFIINDEHNISGAQETERWEKFILRQLG